MSLYKEAVRASIKYIDKDLLRGKRCLVTGATGLIGKALSDALAEAGAIVYAGARSKERFDARFEKRDNIIYYKYDLNDELQGDGFDYVIHAASNADPKNFAADPVGTMTANFIGAYNLLEHVRKTGGRFLYISSGEVYGQYDGACEAFSEDYSGYVNFSEARGCYPSAKRAAENLAVCYKAQYGVDEVIVRLSHTFGPTQLKGDSRAMSEFFALASEGKDIVLRSSGSAVRSYTCVFDAVSGILTVLLKGESGEAYNAANRKSIASIAELAKEIAAASGRQVIFEIGEVKGAGKNVRGVLDGSKLEKLGWKPEYDLKSGVEITLDIMEEWK